MSKNEIRGYIIDAILFVVFSVIAFALPFEKTGLFWLGYIFGVIAIAFQIYVFKISFQKGEDAKSKFYGLPIAKLGVVYLVAQLGVSLMEIILAKQIPLWLGLIINVILLGVVLVGCITAEVMREEITRQDVQIKTDVDNMRKLQSMTASLVGICQDDAIKKILQDLADDFRYSDPVSSEDTKTIENELIAITGEIQKALVEGNTEVIGGLCVKAKVSLAERNRVCKVGK